MYYQQLQHKEPLNVSMPTVPSPVAFSYSLSNQPWVSYKPSKSTPSQPTTCLNCRRLRNVLLSVCALAIFSPILMSCKSPRHVTLHPVVELASHLLVYAAACFTFAGMAISYDILRKQPYFTICAFCCLLHAVATVVALQGLYCLHSAPLSSSQTAGTVTFWAHCVHCVLLRPALWITGGDLDDFPLSKDARVHIWMLCMLCSALLGLGVGVGFGKATTSTTGTRSSTTTPPPPPPVEDTATAPVVDDNPLVAFLLKVEGEIHYISIGDKETTTSVSSPSTVDKAEHCLIQHRSLSSIEASFISACSLSGFWLCLTIIGTFAPTA